MASVVHNPVQKRRAWFVICAAVMAAVLVGIVSWLLLRPELMASAPPARKAAAVEDTLVRPPEPKASKAINLATGGLPPSVADTQSCGVEGLSPAPSEPLDPPPGVQGGMAARWGREPSDAPFPRSYLAAAGRLDAALRTSGDAFTRAVFDWMNVDDEAPASGITTLVKDAIQSNNSRIYALAYGACVSTANVSDICALLDTNKWAALDPGNAVPWVVAFAEAVADGNASAQQQALFNIAASNRIEDGLYAASSAIIAAAPEDPEGLAVELNLAENASGKLTKQRLPIAPLTRYCDQSAKADANAAQLCTRISRLLVQADTLRLRTMGAKMILQATGNSTELDAIEREIPVMNAFWMPSAGVSKCGKIREDLARYRLVGRIGMRRALAERTSESVGR